MISQQNIYPVYPVHLMCRHTQSTICTIKNVRWTQYPYIKSYSIEYFDKGRTRTRTQNAIENCRSSIVWEREAGSGNMEHGTWFGRGRYWKFLVIIRNARIYKVAPSITHHMEHGTWNMEFCKKFNQKLGIFLVEALSVENSNTTGINSAFVYYLIRLNEESLKSLIRVNFPEFISLNNIIHLSLVFSASKSSR